MATKKVVAYINDLHSPSHDEVAYRCMLRAMEEIQPTHLVINGDWVDFYAISRYDKDPHRRLQFQEELDITQGLLEDLRSSIGWQTSVMFRRGNHENRLQHYLHSRAEELTSLRDLELANLLDFQRFNILESKEVMLNGIAVVHGEMVRSRAGYTAHGMIDKYGVSGISGHTHRLAQVSRKTLGSLVTWTENGCLCKLNPEYVTDVADWQHGFSVGTDWRDGTGQHITMYQIKDGVAIVNGKRVDGSTE